MNNDDTITAICTGMNSTITIVRISGSKVKDICSKIFFPLNKNQNPINNPHKLILGKIFKYNNRDFGERVFAVYMPFPKTYTGEDILEIHAHGGNYNSMRILNEILKYDVRMANSGEFTYRAFINGKIDLTQAEAIADLISSNNMISSNLAEMQMNGVFSKSVIKIRNKFIEILANIEAIINFPEEDIEDINVEETLNIIDESHNQLKEMYDTKDIKTFLDNGIKIAIVGPTNTGKSTLLNSLLGTNRSIISNIPGTTRDTVEEYFNVNTAMTMIKLVDTAGIRETNQVVEKLGIERSMKAVEESQIILCVLDISEKVNLLQNNMRELLDIIPKKDNKSIIFVLNKIDIIDKIPEIDLGYSTIAISAREKIGIEELVKLITNKVNSIFPDVESGLIVSMRHATLIEEVVDIIPRVVVNIRDNNLELVAVDLQQIIKLLGNIVGVDKSFDVYDTIFSKFCIGK